VATVTDPGDAAGRREAERAALLDSLWLKLLAIQQEEVARSVRIGSINALGRRAPHSRPASP